METFQQATVDGWRVWDLWQDFRVHCLDPSLFVFLAISFVYPPFLWPDFMQINHQQKTHSIMFSMFSRNNIMFSIFSMCFPCVFHVFWHIRIFSSPSDPPILQVNWRWGQARGMAASTVVGTWFNPWTSMWVPGLQRWTLDHEFSHETWWFSIMWVYQRVTQLPRIWRITYVT